MARRRIGHPRDFTTKQNRALRELLLTVYERYPSQDALGRAIGVAQQSAGRLLRGKDGFSFSTASRVALLGGFAGLDAFFAAKGIGVAMPHQQAS